MGRDDAKVQTAFSRAIIHRLIAIAGRYPCAL